MSARRTSRSRITRLRTIGWLVVTGMLAAAILPMGNVAGADTSIAAATNQVTKITVPDCVPGSGITGTFDVTVVDFAMCA